MVIIKSAKRDKDIVDYIPINYGEFEDLDMSRSYYNSCYNYAVESLARKVLVQAKDAITGTSDKLAQYAFAMSGIYNYDADFMGSDFDYDLPLTKPAIMKHANTYLKRHLRVSEKWGINDKMFADITATEKILCFLKESLSAADINQYILYDSQPKIKDYMYVMVIFINKLIDTLIRPEYTDIFKKNTDTFSIRSIQCTCESIIKNILIIVSILFGLDKLDRLELTDTLKYVYEMVEPKFGTAPFILNVVNISKTDKNATFTYSDAKAVRTRISEKHPYIDIKLEKDIKLCYDNASEFLEAIGPDSIYNRIVDVFPERNKVYASLFDGYTETVTAPEETDKNPGYKKVREDFDLDDTLLEIMKNLPQSIKDELVRMYKDKQINPTLFAMLITHENPDSRSYELSREDWENVDFMKLNYAIALTANENALVTMLDYDRIHGFKDCKLPLLRYYDSFDTTKKMVVIAEKHGLLNKLLVPFDLYGEVPSISARDLFRYTVTEHIDAVMAMLVDSHNNCSKDSDLLVRVEKCMLKLTYSFETAVQKITKPDNELAEVIMGAYYKFRQIVTDCSNPDSEAYQIFMNARYAEYTSCVHRMKHVIESADVKKAVAMSIPLNTDEEIQAVEAIADELDQSVLLDRLKGKTGKAAEHLRIILESYRRFA